MPARAPAVPAPATGKPANLLELVEPLLQYVCRLNRAARHTGGGALAGKPSGETAFFAKPPTPGGTSSFTRGLSLDYNAVRAEVKALLEEIQHRAAGDYRLASQAKKIELVLMFFVDSMIVEARLPFSRQWNDSRLAYERNELAGDEAFFDALEETLKDPSDEASERLAVMYACIGLGFTGIYGRQPEYLREKMLAIAPRVRQYMDTDLSTRFCPSAYENIDTRNLVQPPSNRLVIVGILFLCFTLAVVVSYLWMYRDASEGLGKALDKVLVQDPQPNK